jgi:hypothetical protein
MTTLLTPAEISEKLRAAGILIDEAGHVPHGFLECFHDIHTWEMVYTWADVEAPDDKSR